jgi:hypothetical protein
MPGTILFSHRQDIQPARGALLRLCNGLQSRHVSCCTRLLAFQLCHVHDHAGVFGIHGLERRLEDRSRADVVRHWGAAGVALCRSACASFRRRRGISGSRDRPRC